MSVFGDVASWSLVGIDRRFRGSYCLYHHDDSFLLKWLSCGMLRRGVRLILTDVSEDLIAFIITTTPSSENGCLVRCCIMESGWYCQTFQRTLLRFIIRTARSSETSDNYISPYTVQDRKSSYSLPWEPKSCHGLFFCTCILVLLAKPLEYHTGSSRDYIIIHIFKDLFCSMIVLFLDGPVYFAWAIIWVVGYTTIL